MMFHYTKIQILPFITLMMFSIVSCKKEKDPEPAPSEPEFTTSFTAKVDGIIFEETSLSATEDTATNSITIVASKSPYPAIKLVFRNNITPGYYAFNGPTGPSRGFYYLSETEEFEAFPSTGTLKILSHDITTNRIEAEFFYLAELNSIDYNITQGSFKITYN